MIETKQTILINVGIDDVWTYAQDIEKWAGLMPGMQTCEVIDAGNSRWTLKVGAGGLVRTVKVRVQVDEWAGPGRARFSYKLEGDPVEGGGSYEATAKSPTETEVLLHVRVEGSGPMAPMWEAMGKPLLPTLAGGFAQQLKLKIEEAAGEAPTQEPKKPSLLARVAGWLRSLFGLSKTA